MKLLLLGIAIGLLPTLIEVALVRTYQKNKVILLAIGFHWIAVGALMPFIDLGTSVWLKGLIVGVILTIPFIILEIEKSRNAVIHTCVFAPIWGVVIAYGCSYLNIEENIRNRDTCLSFPMVKLENNMSII